MIVSPWVRCRSAGSGFFQLSHGEHGVQTINGRRMRRMFNRQTMLGVERGQGAWVLAKREGGIWV